MRERAGAPILGNDLHPGAVSLARRDAEIAGVADDIIFSQGDAGVWRPAHAPDVVVSNPPWEVDTG